MIAACFIRIDIILKLTTTQTSHTSLSDHRLYPNTFVPHCSTLMNLPLLLCWRWETQWFWKTHPSQVFVCNIIRTKMCLTQGFDDPWTNQRWFGFQRKPVSRPSNDRLSQLCSIVLWCGFSSNRPLYPDCKYGRLREISRRFKYFRYCYDIHILKETMQYNVKIISAVIKR